MKFADKLFYATTVVLTIIFAVFGIWMLSSYFQKILNREMEQADMESSMQQYLFEMAYQSMEEYGENYAIGRAADSVAAGVSKNGSDCFVWSNQEYFYKPQSHNAQTEAEALKELAEKLDEKNTYAYGVRKLDSGVYLLSVCVSFTKEHSVYLGISKDITMIYEDRKDLLNQYRLALFLLILAGGTCIYFLSRYITKPIRELDKVAGEIAAGDYGKRAKYRGSDEISKLAENFNHMADRLVEQMREKEMEAKQQEDFTAAFAHELKTPLTSIIGYADMLNAVTLSEEERREAYFYIYSQGKRLESLSHKLLELVSMEQTPMQMRAVMTKDLEENIRVTMRPVFQKKKIKGKIILEKGIIYGDRDLLLSLLYNLLDNATKAVEEGGFILLKGRCLEKGYEIKVVDNGRGIPEEEIGRITEAFYMVDKSRSRKEGGAGIGMALCQKIITLHKGRLRIDSKQGEGTVMQLLFPDNRKA